MTSPLSTVPIERRQRMLVLLVLLTALFLVVGILPWALDAPSAVRGLSVVVLIGGVLLALMAWGTQRSIAIDRRRAAEAALDEEVTSAVAEAGVGCSCGHDHDPDEMRVTDAEPTRDCPSGGACTHSCELCTLRG